MGETGSPYCWQLRERHAIYWPSCSVISETTREVGNRRNELWWYYIEDEGIFLEAGKEEKDQKFYDHESLEFR